MRDNEFQRDLCPAGAINLTGPARQRVTLQLAQQCAFAERAVHQHGDTALACQRQQALLRLAVQQVVAELNEVDALVSHDLLELSVAPPFRSGDAHVAQASGCLHGLQQGQLFFPGQQVVDLQQVELRHLPELARGLDLRRAVRGCPDFFCRKYPGLRLQSLQSFTDHTL